MPIDPAGTAPGLAASQVPAIPTVHIRCKRPECDSILAIEVKHPGAASGRRLYQCVKCKISWGVTTGGPVDL
jgi:hypothetical protein